MGDKYLEWMEQAVNKNPELADALSELATLYERKLWHQITVHLEAALEDPRLANDGFLIDLYQNFIGGFAQKINPLKLAIFAVGASKQFSAPSQGEEFLEAVLKELIEAKRTDTLDPLLYLRMQIAQYKLVEGSTTEAKSLLNGGLAELDQREEVDPLVAAAVHFLSMQVHKQSKNYAGFYRSSLLYLAHVPLETLPGSFRVALAVDVSLAALLGEDIYNFGDLMLHPIVRELEATSHVWLAEMLDCFHSGDIHRYDELCVSHASVLNAQPALVAHERRLREKITVMSLLQLVESLPAEQRARISMDAIAKKTKLPQDGVEFLLMKAFALHLIEGAIDQVDGYVSISWVVPRVMTLPEIDALRLRLGGWLDKVNLAAKQLEEEAAGVVEV